MMYQQTVRAREATAAMSGRSVGRSLAGGALPRFVLGLQRHVNCKGARFVDVGGPSV